VDDPRFDHSPEVMGLFVESLLIVALMLAMGIIRC